MIEKDIRTIKERQKVSRVKTAQELKTLSRRQTSHEKANQKQFQSIAGAINLLPTQDVITKTIQDTIKIVVNGKIDKLQGDVTENISKIDMVGEHLKRQDIAIETMSEKIKPIDGAREWLSDAGKIILYVGSVALAVEAIIQLYQLFHHAN